MEDLRAYLGSRPIIKRASNAQGAWCRLTKKLLDVRYDSSLDGFSLMTLSRLSNDQLISALASSEEDKPSGYDENLVTICHECLQRVIHSSKPPHIFLHSDMMCLVDAVISAFEGQGSKFALMFLQRFVKIKGTCPVQLLWLLQKAGILQISSYACTLDKIRKDTSCSHLPYSVFWLLTQPSQPAVFLDMGRDVLASLLITSQGGVPGIHQDISALSVSLLQNFTELMVKWVLDSTASPKSHTVCHLTYLASQELQEACGPDAVQWFALTHLLQLFSEGASSNSMSAVCEAAKYQDKNWTLESCPAPLSDLLTMIVAVIKVNEVIRHLRGAVVKPYTNWKIILLTTSILIKVFPESGNDLMGLTDELLRIGLEGGRQVELAAAFLLARQCCNSRCPNFISYSHWFSCHFGPDSVTARSPMQFQSLLQALTELAPVETADILRVHLNKVPQAPTHCYSMLYDYTALVRTRLADLNESTELTGLFGNRQDALTGMDLRMSDLSKVLEHFVRTGEVMKSVCEAAIFRPQYYREVFLADLLELSEGSCKLSENLESVRHDFISVLKSINKIPEKLLKDYLIKRLPTPQDASSKKIDEVKADNSSIEVKVEKKKKSLQVKPRKI